MYGLAQSFIFPRRSRLVSTNPVSFLYTVNEHEDNRSFTLVNYNYFIFQKKLKMWNLVIKHHVWKSLLEHLQMLVQWIFQTKY